MIKAARQCLLALSFLSVFCLAVNAQTEFGNVPKKASSEQQFIPAGFDIEERIDGDLNKDDQPDIALLLLQKAQTKKFDNRKRALLVLLKSGDGQLQRIGLSDNIVLGTEEGGTKGAHVEVSIKDGVLIVKDSGGSADAWRNTFRFRWDQKYDKLMLIGLDQWGGNTVSGEKAISKSTNLLTHKCITEQFKSSPNNMFNVLVSKKNEHSGLKSTEFDRFDPNSLQPLY